MGIILPFVCFTCTAISHTPPTPGGSSCTTRRTWPVSVTERVHWSNRRDMSRDSEASAGNGAPSIRANSESPKSVMVFAAGGCAFNSTRSAASLMIASMTAPMMATVTVCPAPNSAAVTVAGMTAANSSNEARLMYAGIQRSAASVPWPSRRAATRTLGTIAPRAASRTPSTATRPSHSRLGPTPAEAEVPPTDTSQPSAPRIGMDSASAFMPLGSAMPGWTSQPCGGPSTACKRSASASLSAGSVPRPAAQTTTRPSAQEACNCTSPGSRYSHEMESSSSSSARIGDGGNGFSRAAVRCRLFSVSAKSATTWSRSSPEMPRTLARSSSASPMRRSSTASDIVSSLSNNARSSGAPRPSAMDQIAASSCRTSAIALRMRNRRKPGPQVSAAQRDCQRRVEDTPQIRRRVQSEAILVTCRRR